MNPESSATISWDYIIEFTDDGTQPAKDESEVILLPPVPANGEIAPVSPEAPKA